MDYKKFARRTKEQTLEDSVHESRKKAQKILEGQGIAAVAMYISGMRDRSREHRNEMQDLEFEVLNLEFI